MPFLPACIAFSFVDFARIPKSAAETTILFFLIDLTRAEKRNIVSSCDFAVPGLRGFFFDFSIYFFCSPFCDRLEDSFSCAALLLLASKSLDSASISSHTLFKMFCVLILTASLRL